MKRVNIDCEHYFEPTDEKLRQIYNSCDIDILLCLTWAEGSGLTSAEALACMRSLVSSNNGVTGTMQFLKKLRCFRPRKTRVD